MSPVTAQPSSTSTTSAPYVGRITAVGSRRVRQSTTARATDTGTSGTQSTSAQVQPTATPTIAPATAAASALFQPRPGRRAMSGKGSGGSGGTTVEVASTVPSTSDPAGVGFSGVSTGT